ncbi:MAG: ribonuclease H-like domain-containing protein [Planctomycetes bacterium]|nr:ribonuclease H-like domain-containing protein [Planctomycetota bacterium]
MSPAVKPVLVERLADVAAHEGLTIDVFAVLRSVERRTTAKDQAYFDLQLADTSANVNGKVWGDDRDAFTAIGTITPGSVVKVRGEVRTWQGVLQLKLVNVRPVLDADPGYDPERVLGRTPSWLHARACKTLVIDIETVPDTGIREMPQTIVKALTEFSKRKEMDESLVRGLSPFFAKVVALAFAEADGDDDAPIDVLAVPRDDAEAATLPDWAHAVDEATLLESFWTLAAAAGTVVTYNGMGFDVPFLVGRSLIHGIPARVDLLSQRYKLRPHLDLLEILGQRGRGPSNLDVVCWALGIESPKGEMDGSMVAPAYASGRIAEIATYNRADVRATRAVYRRVRDLLLRFRQDWGG